ncbi:hypothetical protein [Brevibacillus sp. SYSU BS000544]|uniref:hypothetical protein n=1 Tax=Brevibacillus sp. SYSU BS000544 TaxID=3416443 RepID=UPI003CE5C69E
MDEMGKQIDAVSNQLTRLRVEFWADYTLFTWQWWMLVGVCIVMSILFITLLKKDKLLQSIAYFGVVFIINKYLDDLATALDWYDYRMQLNPIIPTMLTANLFAVPMAITLVYQRFVRWKWFLLALGAFSFFLAYISLPLMKLVGMYQEKVWNSHLSFASLVVIAVIAKLIIDRIEIAQNVQRERKHHFTIHRHYRDEQLLVLFPFMRWFLRKEKTD